VVSTVVFTIFPYIVALVHTAPYVDLYHHYRRRTLAKVPRHSSICPFFHKPELSHNTRFLPSSTHHGRRRPGPLPPPMAGICPFQCNTRVPPIMGDDGCSRFVVIRAGRGKIQYFCQGDLRGFRCDITIKPPGPPPLLMAGGRPFRANARVPPIMSDDCCARFVVIRAGRGKHAVLPPGPFSR